LCPISATKDELFVQNFPAPAKAGLGKIAGLSRFLEKDRTG
jgi:hypothetical protein